MRLAVPIWEGRISPVFDVARHLLLVEAENGLERSREERAVGEHSPYSWVPMLAELGVDSLICGAITEALSAALTGHGIRVIPWIRGEVDEVLSAYFSGELSEIRLLMPGTRQVPSPTPP